jgi:molybdopterin-guanine dinucleotide biosynthesis protein A
MKQAVNKIRNEMDANTDNSYIQIVGQSLLDHIHRRTRKRQKKLAISKKRYPIALLEMKKAS